MEIMANTQQNKPDSRTQSSSEALIDQFLDAIWMERGLSKNTLGAYRPNGTYGSNMPKKPTFSTSLQNA
jgi:hypothetical protein